ncbi:hypothetical protein PTI98_003279 [Pleurotus ostreatus]|nr:hypothetical protein PTI98_003279 [Pleurotus ostreatus]
MAAIYAVYTSPNHPTLPNHLPTLVVTPHGQPTNILYSYLHTNFNSENYLLTPSPQGDLCVAKLFPPRPKEPGKGSASDPGHGSSASSRVVRCEASRNLKWSIANTGVISPIYKLSLPSPDSPDLPLFQISKPNPNAAFWSMFYFAYAGHNIPPKRIEFGKIQKNPPGPNGGGTRISITGKTPEEKAVWQTLGEGNEDCVEWVVLCAALNLLDDEIMKAVEKNPLPVEAIALRPFNFVIQDQPPVLVLVLAPLFVVHRHLNSSKFLRFKVVRLHLRTLSRLPSISKEGVHPQDIHPRALVGVSLAQDLNLVDTRHHNRASVPVQVAAVLPLHAAVCLLLVPVICQAEVIPCAAAHPLQCSMLPRKASPVDSETDIPLLYVQRSFLFISLGFQYQ